MEFKVATREEFGGNDWLWDNNQLKRREIATWGHDEIKEFVDGYILEVSTNDLAQAIIYTTSSMNFFNMDTRHYAMKELVKQYKLK